MIIEIQVKTYAQAALDNSKSPPSKSAEVRRKQPDPKSKLISVLIFNIGC